MADAKDAAANTGEERGTQLIQLQVDLIRVLSRLDQLYRKISSEKKNLISNKQKYNYRWFARRMESLDDCLKVVTETIGIAKVIGDGYAWIFYRNDNDLIEKHTKLQRQVLLPPGVGGIGERAFVEKTQGIGRHFILYHGITSYLRLGDISFINPAKCKVDSIGELKTRHAGGDTYQITLGYVSGTNFDPLDLSTKAENARTETDEINSARRVSERTRTTFNRQMSQLADAIRKKDAEGPEYKHNRTGEYYFQKLEGLVERTGLGKMEAEKVGSGLLVTTLRVPKSRLNSLRMKNGDGWVGNRIQGIEEHAKTILNPDFQDNCIFFGNLVFDDIGFPKFRAGALPVMWWPIKPEILKDIVFGNVMVLTFHNPAHFWQMLRDRGFDVEVDNRSNLVCARRTSGKHVHELRNMEYFTYLARCHLMSEDTIIAMIDLSLDQIDQADLGPNGEVRIKPVVRIR